MTEIIATIISSFLTLVGVIIVTIQGQTITKYQISELRKEVEKNNMIIKDLPVIREKVDRHEKIIERWQNDEIR